MHNVRTAATISLLTCLTFTATAQGYPKDVLMQMLISAGAGELHQAAAFGDVEEIRKILARDYPIDKLDSIANTPLHWAAWMGKLEAVQTLIEEGAKSAPVNDQGLTPEGYAQMFAPSAAQIPAYRAYEQIVELLAQRD